MLTLAESQSDRESQRAPRSSGPSTQYDLRAQGPAQLVEAINNKAWILHYLPRQTRQALELVLALQKRVNCRRPARRVLSTRWARSRSPIGKTASAEQSYLDGLKKAPEHPVLNFHFGKMIAADRSRAVKAQTVPEKALESPATGSARR